MWSFKIRLVELLTIVVSIQILNSNCDASIAQQQPAAQQQQAQGNVSNPLIYKRLRFDLHALQIYKRYQKHLALDEKRVTLRYNETLRDNQTWYGEGGGHREVELSYYENPEVDVESLTYDDLIFDALDRTYHARLWPAYIYSYDKKEDRERASDPQKVSPDRCDKELTFLMEQLAKVERARWEETSQARGPRLSNALNPEVMAYFEAFGQEEQGLLLGNYHWTGGTWRECNKRLVFNVDERNLSNSVEFNGRYCLASIRSPTWNAKAAERAREWDAIDQFRSREQLYDYRRYFRIQVGICLPESCDSRTFDVASRRPLLQRLATHKLPQPMRSYDLVDLYCLPDETSELRKLEPSGRLFVLFSILWVALVLAFTARDHWQTPPPGQRAPAKPIGVMDKLTSSMSLIQNYHRLVETKSCQPTPPLSVQLKEAATAAAAAATRSAAAPGECEAKAKLISSQRSQAGASPAGALKLAPNDLLFLNFIKVACIPIILFGHVGLQMKQLDRFALDLDCLWPSVAHFHFSAALFVDWFFVITGFLTTYIVFSTQRVARNTPLDWFYSIVHRYWRLAPLYVLLFWFVQSVFMYTSSGPLWDYGSNNMTARSICRQESFWVPLTLTSNWGPIYRECVVPTWYVSADFQFYLLTPFLLVLLHKSPLAGWLVILGSIGASNSLRLHRYLTDRHAKPLDLMRPRYDLYIRNNWDMHPTYLFPQYRISPFLVGMLAGHYVYMVLSNRWRSPLYYAAKQAQQRSGALVKRRCVWLTSVAVLCSLMWATRMVDLLFPVSLERHARYAAALVYSNHHTMAALALALVLVTMMFGQFEPLKQFMARPVFTLISRLNYIVFLVQLEAITWFIQSAERTEEQTNFVLFKYFFAMAALVYPAAAILALLLELPLSQLERNFVAPLFRSNAPASRTATTAAAELTAIKTKQVGAGGAQTTQPK